MAFVALIFTTRNLLIILNIYLYLSSFSRDLSHSTPADLNCKTLHVSHLLSNPHINSRLNISRRSAFTKSLSSDMKLFRGLHVAMNFSISVILISLSNDIATNPGRANKNDCNPKGSFTIFYQNVRSLKSTYWDNSSNSKESKLSCFHDVVMTNQFDVIALSETWLDSSVSNDELIPNGYMIIRRDRQDKRGGGVLLAVKDSIKTDPFNFTSISLELAGVVINSLSKKLLVCVCYRPPNAGNEFHEEFDRFLKCVNDSRCKDVIILGDFNFPSVEWLNGSGFSDLRAECGFTELLQEAGFFQLINAPTCGHNLIDLLPYHKRVPD